MLFLEVQLGYLYYSFAPLMVNIRKNTTTIHSVVFTVHARVWNVNNYALRRGLNIAKRLEMIPVTWDEIRTEISLIIWVCDIQYDAAGNPTFPVFIVGISSDRYRYSPYKHFIAVSQRMSSLRLPYDEFPTTHPDNIFVNIKTPRVSQLGGRKLTSVPP